MTRCPRVIRTTDISVQLRTERCHRVDLEPNSQPGALVRLRERDESLGLLACAPLRRKLVALSKPAGNERTREVAGLVLNLQAKEVTEG